MRWDVHYVDGTASTNTDVLALARAGAPVGTVLRAGHQTAGRGRLGRTWLAPPGSSLLASILLPAEPVPFVVMARVALAASDACLDLAGVDPALKWPNDLLVGERKLAGLLAEADSGSPTVVVGIGCNLTWAPEDDEGVGTGGTVPAATDLAAAAASVTVPGPGPLLEGLLLRLDGWLPREAAEVLAEYRRRCTTLGRSVRVRLPDRTFDGLAADISSTGELEVAVGAGRVTVRAGDVVHVRAN